MIALPVGEMMPLRLGMSEDRDLCFGGFLARQEAYDPQHRPWPSLTHASDPWRRATP